MMPRNHIIRKYTLGYVSSKSQKKINHEMYISAIKLFVKNEKKINKKMKL